LKLAIFDICGTLYFDNTTYSYLRWLSNEGIIKNNKKIMDAPFFLRGLNALSSSLFQKDYYRDLQIKQLEGLPRNIIEHSATEFVEKMDANRISITNHLLEDYKSKGYTIVIASATIAPIANSIANKLGVDYFSSEIEFIDNYCTGRLSRDLLYSKKKILLNLIDAAETTIVVTDNFTDLELILSSDHCHLVVRGDKDIKRWEKQLKNNLQKVEFIKKKIDE